MELLCLAPNNEFLNAAEVTLKSTPASVAEMLHKKMFEGVSDVFDPRFLALASHLACSTKQQTAFSLRSQKDLRNSLREMLLMVSRPLSLSLFLFLFSS